ncbi:MAG: hypothetical protein GXY17_03495 [Clostridiaceae bacterium]|jgi:bacteriorhodopsin|nr:hypothetical protein [Clostridiaceae bacterium]
MADMKRDYVERRKGPDIVIKAVWWIVGIGWLLITAALFFTDQAMPARTTFFDRLFDVSVRDYWDTNLLRYVFYVFFINFCACIVGFMLNMMRQKRKTDKISKSILVLTTINLIGILWYFLR